MKTSLFVLTAVAALCSSAASARVISVGSVEGTKVFDMTNVEYGDGSKVVVSMTHGLADVFLNIQLKTKYTITYDDGDVFNGEYTTPMTAGMTRTQRYESLYGWDGDFSVDLDDGGRLDYQVRLVNSNVSITGIGFYQIEMIDTNPLPVPSPSPAPEPSTWALLIVGFGLIGMRRRYGVKTFRSC